MITRTLMTTGLAGVALLAFAGSAQAQTAYQLNRANQALQICSSPMGPSIPECAQLRGQLGVSATPAAPGLGALGSGKAAGIAGLLGSALSASRNTAPAPMPTPAANSAMIQQAVATCVRNAAGNEAMVQGCLAIASRSSPPQPARALAPTSSFAAPGLAAPYATGPSHNASAMATLRAGQTYQACVAANPNNWQGCLKAMNGGPPVP